MIPESDGASLRFMSGGGDAGALMRSRGWAASPLGAAEAWPEALKTLVGVMLGSAQAMFVAWGPEQVMLYNDRYAELLQDRHPAAMGRTFAEVWWDIMEEVGPILDRAYAGESTQMDDIMFMMHRHGRKVETHFAFSYTPVRGADGEIAGMFCACEDTTSQVMVERRLADATDRQRRMFEQAPGLICTLEGPDHVFTFVNNAHRRLFGSGGWIGKPVREVWPELEAQGLIARLDGVYATATRFIGTSAPVRYHTTDGREEERLFDLVYEPVCDETGNVTGIFCEGFDVGERDRARAELADSEARFRTLAETIGQVFYLSDANERRLLYVSPAFDRIWGYPRTELFDRVRAYSETIHPDDQAAALKAYHEQQEGRETQVEYRIRRPDGEERWILDRSYPVRDEAGRLVWAAGLAEDVTDARRAEVELRTSRTQLQAVADALPVLVSFIDAGLRYRFVNHAYEEWFGLKREDIIGRPMRDVLGDASIDALKPLIDKVLAGEGVTAERELAYRHGGTRFVKIDYVPARDSGRVVGWYALVQDITEARRAADALRLAQADAERRAAEQAAILSQLAEGVIVTDAQGEIVFVNEAAARLHGVKELGVAPDDYSQTYHLFHENGEPYPFAELPLARAVLDDKTTIDARWKIRRPDGTEVLAIGSARPVNGQDGGRIGAVLTVRDDTARHAAEKALRDLNETLEERVALRQAELETAQEALRQSQKLEAMGQLTGGVAHDFNNLLTPIIGGIDLLHRRGLGGERERRLMEGALQSAERAKTLVQRLLAFARRQPLQPRAVDISELVAGMTDLIASTLGPQIRVLARVEPGLPPAHADLNQIEMALLNLSVNARDAMPDGGVLTISAAKVAVEAGEALPAGDYVRLSVADTGVGMDEDTLKRAVEPFFSTKGIGKGTGLGLSMVHGLALQLGGRFQLSSTPGLGTHAELWLRADEAVSEAGRALPEHAVAVQGAGTALLVDDEELVRASTADMLADMGYQVTEAASGREALALLRAGAPFDLLVTDHLMPGMTGTDLARAARTLRPGLPALVVSGYAEVEGIAPDLPRLTKPFRLAELSAAIAGMSN